MSNDQIAILPFDSLVTVEFSGRFYAKMQNLLFALMQEKSDKPEELALILKELETREPQNMWEEQVSILLAIIFEIDNQAAKQKVLVKKPLSDYLPKDDSPEASPES
jgi:hypothetical protein